MPKAGAPKPKGSEKEPETPKAKETNIKDLCFKCQFCGETKPIDKMVMLRQYYPPKACCKECARIAG